MTIFSIKAFPLWILALLIKPIYSQDNFITFWQPQIAINYQVGDHYRQNFTLANRNIVFSDGDLEFKVRQVDLNHFSKWIIKDNQSISLGLLWRSSDFFDDDFNNEFRLMEQYIAFSRPHSVRYAHRLRAEQRIFSNLTIHRFRYRFGIDFPLQGQKLDVGEVYSLWSLEGITSVANSLENGYGGRLRGGLGWRYGQNSRLQFTLEYRLVNFTRSTFHVFLFETALIMGL